MSPVMVGCVDRAALMECENGAAGLFIFGSRVAGIWRVDSDLDVTTTREVIRAVHCPGRCGGRFARA